MCRPGLPTSLSGRCVSLARRVVRGMLGLLRRWDEGRCTDIRSHVGAELLRIIEALLWLLHLLHHGVGLAIKSRLGVGVRLEGGGVNRTLGNL